MKKAILTATVAAAAMAFAPAVNATVVDGIVLAGNPLTDSFSGITAAGSFVDVYNFNVPIDGAATGSAVSIALTSLGGPGDVDFTSIILTGPAGSFNFAVDNTTTLSTGALSPVWLTAGAHTLVVSGTSVGNGSYGGNMNVNAVPEPATWAMMVAGIAAVGSVMRRRSQNVRVAFS